MANARKAVIIVVALLVGSLMAAFLLPVGINAMTGPEETTITQGVDEPYNIQGDLNVTVTSVTDGTSATYTVEAGGDSVTGETVNVGSDSTVTVNGADVTINPTTVTSTDATTTYTTPTTYGWGGGASAMWIILPVLLVLAVFLYFTGVALDEM